MTPATTAGRARNIVHLQAGAHLYGTATPTSDFDTKTVFLPSSRDILLQQTPATIVDTPNRAPGQHREPGAADTEAHSLQRFLSLLAAGQPLAIEMLFAPDSAMLSPPDPLWRDVQSLGSSLVTKRAGIFVRYCRKQAEQYGARGERIAAARQVLAILAAAEAKLGSQARLHEIAAELANLAAISVHVAVVDVPVQADRTLRHLDVCGRRAPFTSTIRSAHEMTERLIGGYGERARQAERQSGVDWKALSHAVRVGREAIELFATGRLHFPLASAPRLLAIKSGQLPYSEVANEIETLLGEVERSAAASSLPNEPDLTAAEALVMRAYRAQVLEGVG